MTQAAALPQSRSRANPWRPLSLAFAALLLGGCASVQYSALEQVGIHKRDILVDRVEDARNAQSETREELVSAYDELKALTGFDGGDLEAKYEELSAAVERSRKATGELDDHLAAIDRVSEDLFDEWESELDLYSSESLRADQSNKLAQARQRYAAMRQRMQVARDRVDPVMSVLNDNVLFLKHSLNASALAALRDQAGALDQRVDALVRDMQSAIDEADAFIQRMRVG